MFGSEFLLVDQLKDYLKSYTILANVANATGRVADKAKADSLLKTINDIRTTLAINAEMREIFVAQKNIPAAASVNTIQNKWFSKNDISFCIARGIAALVATTKINLEAQGARKKVITREIVPWQQLFATVQSVALGQQTLFDLPETLRFGENQALNIGLQGQNAAGYLFLHGATIKERLDEATIKSLQDEFLNTDGTTKYLPETQLVPIEFQFPSATVNTFATDVNGSEDIFSTKNERSVLLLEVSTTATLSRFNKLTDEGRNQTICENVEQAGVASNYTNAFCTYYPLPFPHLLRRGDRLKAVIQNGSVITGTTQDADILHHVTFRGITI